MALHGDAKKLYHREYMRRRRAGLSTRGVVKPKVMEQWCSECVLSRADRGQLWERLPPLPVLLRGGQRSVRRGARRA
jgi:hypothetical protein